MSFRDRLERNLGDYFARPAIGRAQLRETIDNIVQKLPETVIFGGMIREFGFGNAKGFTSDIDLVSVAARPQIYEAISIYQPSLNKFGGYRFIVNKRRFDIWSLRETWALSAGHVSGSSFEDLLKTTFFNVDAACYDVHRKQLSLLESCEYGISHRALDINLLENPNPEGMARRALALMLTRQLSMSKALTQFVVQTLEPADLNWVEQRLLNKAHEFLKSEQSGVFRFDLQQQLDA